VIFLQATAASFKEAWRMVDAIMLASESRKLNGGNNGIKDDQKSRAKEAEKPVVLRTTAEDVV